MTAVIISIVSGKGSPGASTAALSMTLTWPRPVLLVEADPAGGSLVLGYAAGAGISGRNLTGVRVAARRSSMTEAIWANVVALGERRWLLPGVDTSRQAEAVDYRAVAAALRGLAVDVIIDAGRIPAPAAHQALWASADLVIVATRSTLPAVHAAQAAASMAREALGATGSAVIGAAAPRLQSVIIGPGRPYPERDIRAAMADVAAVAGVLAWDPASAGVLVDGLPAPRAMTTMPLTRSSARLAKTLAQQAASPAAEAGLLVSDHGQPGQVAFRAPTPGLAREKDTAGPGHAEHVQAEVDGAASGFAGEYGPAPAHRAAPAAAVARHSSHAPAAATARTGGGS